MGRFKKVTAKTPEDAASEGLSSMAAFFKPVLRPPPVNKGGRPATVTRAGGRKAAPTVPLFIGPQPPGLGAALFDCLWLCSSACGGAG